MADVPSGAAAVTLTVPPALAGWADWLAQVVRTELDAIAAGQRPDWFIPDSKTPPRATVQVPVPAALIATTPPAALDAAA